MTDDIKLRLPKLLYVGDVPVENHVHGSAFLFRLLESYPVSKLRIIEGARPPHPSLRLAAVKYATLRPVWSRLLQTRLSSLASPWAAVTAESSVRAIPGILEDFRPEAVLTVAHGHVWMAAARYARVNGLPLHLIVHDDYASERSGFWAERRLIARAFERCYRQAASRWCVSAAMAEEYFHRYGLPGDVLNPFRAADSVVFPEPPERLRNIRLPLTVAFCGSLHLPYAEALQRLARILRPRGGRVLVFGPRRADDTIMNLLNESNIEMRGHVDSLITCCREEADVMFIPMSFDAGVRQNAELSFPSKLADSTSVGLPLLIYGPAYCSAVKWAGTDAEVVTDNSVEALSAAVDRLSDGPYRWRLAERAIQRGREDFSYQRATAIFQKGLVSSRALSSKWSV